MGTGTNSETAEECLLKWFRLSAAWLLALWSASCDRPTLRLGVRVVNMDTQYVVDITTGTHDIAPTLRQKDKIAAIARLMRESARAVEILAESEIARAIN